MSPANGAEAVDGSGFRVDDVVPVALEGQGLGGARCSVVGPCDPGAVVDQNADVDAHDGDDASHVKVHHEQTLKMEEKIFKVNIKVKYTVKSRFY